jgi:hypothetical protein
VRIEIRQSGGTPCQLCGALPLVHAPTLNRHLEADIHSEIDALKPGWWRPFTRRRHRKAKKLFSEISAQLRELTIYA